MCTNNFLPKHKLKNQNKTLKQKAFLFLVKEKTAKLSKEDKTRIKISEFVSDTPRKR